jgi:4-amino-4-deoxy-L-arabinose transferase-like glycosyltransferase
MLEKIFEKKVLYILNVGSFLLCIFCIYFVVTCSPVNVDSAFYLCTSKLIAEGLVPFRDIQMFYTPIALYILSVPYSIMGNPGYESMLLLMILIKAAGALIIYKIVVLLWEYKQLALFISLNFFLSTLLYDGQSILLESFVVFFQLLSIYFIFKSGLNKSYFFISGVALAFAFLSKQYGVFILPALLVYVLIGKNNVRDKILQTCLLLAGFGVVIIIFIFYYYMEGVTPQQLLASLAGRNYGLKSFSSLIDGTLNMLYRNGLMIIFIPLMVIVNKGLLKDNRFLLIVLALAGSFSPLYFQYFGHYFLHILPFLYLLSAYILTVFYKHPDSFSRYSKMIFLSVVYCFVLTLGKSIKENIITINDKKKSWQYATAKEISEVVTTKKNVLSHDSTVWPYLCDWEPINPRKGGYEFPGFSYTDDSEFCTSFLSKEEYFSFVRNADYIILDKLSYSYFKKNNLLTGHRKIKTIRNEDIWIKIN